MVKRSGHLLIGFILFYSITGPKVDGAHSYCFFTIIDRSFNHGFHHGFMGSIMAENSSTVCGIEMCEYCSKVSSNCRTKRKHDFTVKFYAEATPF